MATAAFSEISSRYASAPGNDGQPKYKRLADALVEAIEAGVLGPGDRLPAEDAMAALCSVSLGTAQRAMSVLAERGIVTRSPRRGTFVAGRKSSEVHIYRFKDPGTGQVVTPFTRALSVTEAAADGKWRRFLDCERCVRVERLQWVEGDPPAYSEFFIPFEFGSHLLDEPVETLHGASLHRVIAERFDYPTLRTAHALTCGALSAEACRHLLLPEGSVGTVWDVVGYSFKRATTYQSLQLPVGHRPIEWEATDDPPA